MASGGGQFGQLERSDSVEEGAIHTHGSHVENPWRTAILSPFPREYRRSKCLDTGWRL